MRIFVKKGACIELLLKGDNRYHFEGCVINIDDNEIIIQPQRYIAVPGITREGLFIDANEIDQTKTMDAPYPEIHVDRAMVIGWTYMKIPSVETAPRTTFSGYYLAEQIDFDKIHHYTDGICTGFGEYLDK